VPSRRQIYRRRRVVVFGGLLLVLSLGFYLPMTLLAPLRAADAVVAEHVEEPGAAAALSFPGYGASAIGAVDFPGVLAASGDTAPLPMASITKVVTALTVLQTFPLGVDDPGPSVTMTSTDVGYYDEALAQNGTVASVRAGQVYTQRELLDLALIKSANNYSMSLAVWAFGSMDAYLAAAQAWVAAHSLPSVVITDSTGLDPGNVATASDLVELARLALADPLVRSIVGTVSIEVPNVGAIENTNDLLGNSGVTGIKTGTLDDFGANLLFSADYAIGSSSVTVVGVVLGGVDHPTIDAAITALLGTVQAGFHELDVSDVGEDFGTYTTAWGQTAEAEAGAEAVLLTWSDTPVTVEVETDPVRIAEAGSTVGSATFTAGVRTITVPLVLSGPLTDPGPGWRLTHPGELF
jgi:D-alanyl-D-alanine carboxypeptidase (penicillin-binding protein 5/6)